MMKAGRYYVGDLCYVMHDKWDDFCAVTIDGNEVLDGEMNLPSGVRFATFRTAFGDGEYRDEQGRSYGVDAGLIGCIRVEDIAEEELENLDLGHVIDFPENFQTYSANGVIVIGHVRIDTNDCGYDDEDDESCEDEGDDRE